MRKTNVELLKELYFDLIGEQYKRIRLIILGTIVLLISLITFFNNYESPAGLFWDENYHIVSAERYIQKDFFMELHPPLGKLFIALGEVIINPNSNIDKSKMVQEDYLKTIPSGLSFIGYRFFPTIFATLSALLIFIIFYLISKHSLLSFLFSSLYLFENALIVHSRGAMLESTQLFFVLGAIAYFLFSIQKRKIKIFDYIIIGLLCSAAFATKVNSLIIAPLGLVLLFKENKEYFKNFYNTELNNILNYILKNRGVLFKILIKLIIYIISIGIIFCLSYFIHFTLAKKIINNNYFTASDKYKEIINTNKATNLNNLPLALKEHIYYSDHHTKGVPTLNVCKPDENGSSPISWPLGGKSIDYKWESNGDTGKYLYLQGNPAIWMLSFMSVVLSFVLVMGYYIFGIKVKNVRLFNLIQVFLLLYAGYMFSVLQVERVLYLYHYFIPLIFSMILTFLLFNYLFEEYINNKNDAYKVYIIATIMFVLIFYTYIFFSPLSYFLPITKDAFTKREWFAIWQLKAQ